MIVCVVLLAIRYSLNVTQFRAICRTIPQLMPPPNSQHTSTPEAMICAVIMRLLVVTPSHFPLLCLPTLSLSLTHTLFLSLPPALPLPPSLPRFLRSKAAHDFLVSRAQDWQWAVAWLRRKVHTLTHHYTLHTQHSLSRCLFCVRVYIHVCIQWE